MVKPGRKQLATRSEALELPLKGLGHGAIEIVDELKDLPPEVIGGGEIAPAKQSADQDAEPTLYLIQPGGVLGNVNKPNAMSRVTQKSCPTLHGCKNAQLTFHAQVILKLTASRHQSDQ